MKKLIITGLILLSTQFVSAQEVRYLVGKKFSTIERLRLNIWEKDAKSNHIYSYGTSLTRDNFEKIKLEFLKILDFYGFTDENIYKNESVFYSDSYNEDSGGTDKLDEEILRGLSKINVTYSKEVRGKFVVLVFLTENNLASLTISDKKML